LVAGDAAALWMAGLALGDIYFRFAWRAWHLGHWAGSGGALGLDWSPVTPRHCVAGVAIGVIHLRFTWQAYAGVALGDIHLLFVWALKALGWLWWPAWTGLVAGDAAALWVGRRGTC